MASIGELVAKLELDSKQFDASLQAAGQGVNTFSGKLTGLTALIGGAFTLSVAKAGAELEMLEVATLRVGHNAGLTEGQVRGLVKRLEDTNTFGKNAWGAIQTLVNGGLLPMATALEQRVDPATGKAVAGIDSFIFAIKDMSANARVSSSEGIARVTQALNMMNPAFLDSMGIQVNLAQLWRANADVLEGLSGNALIAAQKQIFFNEIMAQSSKVAGVYADTYQTAGKHILSIEDATASLTQLMGRGMQPVFRQLTDQFLKLIVRGREWANTNQEMITRVTAFGVSLITLVAAGYAIVKVVGIMSVAFRLLGTAMTIAQLRAGALGLVLIGLSLAISKALSKQIDFTDKTAESVDDLSGAFKGWGDAGANAAKKIGDEAGKAADAIKDIKQQIEDENIAFNKALADIVDRRMENVKQNKKALKQEEEEFRKQQEKAVKDYEKKTFEMKDQNQQRLRDLEISLEESLLVGSDTYSEDVAMYRQMVEEEKLEGEERLAEITKQFQEETAERKSEFEETTNELKKKIAADEQLLTEHAAVIGTINRSIIDDEIEELVKGHQRRLAELNKQLKKEDGAWGSHFDDVVAGADDMLRGMEELDPLNLNDLLVDIDWGQLLKDTGIEMANFFVKLGGWVLVGILKLGTLVAKALAKLVGKIVPGAMTEAQIQANADYLIRDVQSIAATGIQFKATGTRGFSGGLSVVGERGPELVELPQGSKIYNAGETRSMAREYNQSNNHNVTINQYIQMDNQMDMDANNRELKFLLNTL
jgi:hypothetical protein